LQKLQLQVCGRYGGVDGGGSSGDVDGMVAAGLVTVVEDDNKQGGVVVFDGDNDVDDYDSLRKRSSKALHCDGRGEKTEKITRMKKSRRRKNGRRVWKQLVGCFGP